MGTLTGGIGILSPAWNETTPGVFTKVPQYTYTVDTASPRHQHHISISTRYSLDSPTFQALSYCSTLYIRGFHVGCCVVVTSGMRGAGALMSVLASSSRASTRPTLRSLARRHGGECWVLPSSSWALFRVMMRPWSLSSSLSSC
jgi:hypothetical protein